MKKITRIAVENIKETSHWTFAIAPVVAFALAQVFETDTHYLELIFIFLAIIVNFIILFLRSKAEENKELTLFYTFWYDKLKPVKLGREQKYNVKIAVVEDEEKAYFSESLEQRFHKEGISLVVNADDPKLRFSLIEINSQTGENTESLIANFDEEYDFALKNATAIVVVRTGGLEDNPWVYKAIDNWAYKHSEVPILFAKEPNKPYKNEIADNYLWIPDDSKSLPWRLLQRALQRGKAWRIQSSYNRAMVWNIFYLSLMCIVIGLFWVKAQKNDIQAKQFAIGKLQDEINKTFEVPRNEYYTSHLEASKIPDDNIRREKMKPIWKSIALQTKSQFEKSIVNSEDKYLHVSYWFKENDVVRQFITTEERRPQTNTPAHKDFIYDKTSVIGCGFLHQNVITEWDKNYQSHINNLWDWNYKNRPKIWDINEKQIIDSDCVMFPESYRAMTSIVCDSFSKDDIELTVGICVFTESGINIFGDNYRKFLRERTKEFFNEVYGLNKNKKLVSFIDN